MWSNFNGRLKELFAPITLTQLNAQAAFLDRIDTKFVVSEDELIFLIEELKKDFYVLDINGKSVFEYDSIYMDTEDYLFYNQHQDKKVKSRTKVRTREYVDSGIAFFEYKQKQGKTIRKFRYQSDLAEHGKMTSEWEKFFQGLYMSFYDGQKTPTNGIEQAKGCSKYCMSLLYTGVMRKRGVFEKTMEKADALAVK